MGAARRHAAGPAPAGLRLSRTQHEKVSTLHVAGTVSAENAHELQAAARDAVRAEGATPTTLVVDLTEAGTLGVAGIDALWEVLAACGEQVALHVAATAVVRESLLLTGLHDLVTVHPTQEGALAALTGTDEATLLRDTLADRERQLASQPIIEQAKGMLRQDFGFTDQQAFDQLVALSQESNTKLRDLAEQLVEALTGTASPSSARTVIAGLRACRRPPASRVPEDEPLVGELAKFTRAFAGAGTVLGVLEQVLAAAYRLVPGVTLASITLRLPDGRFETPVESAPSAGILDQVQYETNQGPCLDVARPGGPGYIRSDDLARESAWPRFAAAATEHGYSAVLSTALLSGAGPDDWTGALNLYGSGTNGLPADAHEPALLLATHASLALANTGTRTRAELRDAHLRRAIDTRDVIGRAKGILMQRRGCTADEAFDQLRRVSRALNARLAELAGELATRHIELDLRGE